MKSSQAVTGPGATGGTVGAVTGGVAPLSDTPLGDTPDFALSGRRRPPAGLMGRRVPVLPLLLLAPLVVFGIFGPLLYPHDPETFKPSIRLMPPAWMEGGDWTYVLGTDEVGRDFLTRLIAGARASLIVAFVGVAIAGVVGVLVGMAAGIARGAADTILMRIVDMQLAIPPILLGVLVGAALGGGLRTIVLVIAISFWPAYARVTRAETLGLMQREYVELARVAGAGTGRVLRRHVLPNLFSTVIVLAALQLGMAIVLESALTFLGIGLQPPEAAWGLMISTGRVHLDTAWWVSTIPGIAIFLTVLGANLLGDWLRDRLDPKLRQA